MRLVDQAEIKGIPVRGIGITFFSGVGLVIDLWHKRLIIGYPEF